MLVLIANALKKQSLTSLSGRSQYRIALRTQNLVGKIRCHIHIPIGLYDGNNVIPDCFLVAQCKFCPVSVVHFDREPPDIDPKTLRYQLALSLFYSYAQFGSPRPLLTFYYYSRYALSPGCGWEGFLYL